MASLPALPPLFSERRPPLSRYGLGQRLRMLEPEDAQQLLQLIHSLVMISFPVEAWGQPHVPDSGAAYLDRIVEPRP